MSPVRRVQTSSEAETRALASRIARALPAGSLLGLVGDLGAGKTVFVQGLAEGLSGGEQARVRSPSYIIVEEHATEPRLIHADLYRIGDVAELDGIGFEEIVDDPGAIVAVEWFERAEGLVLPPALQIVFETGQGDVRRLTFSADDPRYAAALQAVDG